MLKKTDFRIHAVAVVSGNVWSFDWWLTGDDPYEATIDRVYSHDPKEPFTRYVESLDEIIDDLLNHPDFVSCKLESLKLVIGDKSKTYHKLVYPKVSEEYVTQDNITNLVAHVY